jgi:acetylornithine deacetylase/succinyl-diaminopimelate desuccinylase-like protein
MSDIPAQIAELARDMVAIDSRSSVSNFAIAARVAAALDGFEVETLDYTDAAGVAKRAIVAARGPWTEGGALALSGHMDTVPDTGWQDDPWSGRIADGVLHGLGSTDMKGPVAACIVAARTAPADVPAVLLITTDEETTKDGARLIAQRSEIARRARLGGIVVVEPTEMVPVRGHRGGIGFTITSEGIQAHSSSGRGRNANWALIPFLTELRELNERFKADRTLHDPAYDPTFSELNIVIDNHGTAVNVTVPLATVRIRFRVSASIDPDPVIAAVTQAAERAGLSITMRREPKPPELPADHPLIRAAVAATGAAARTVAFGTDASELQALAPCVVLGPGDIGVAHRPGESVRLDALVGAVPVYHRMLADHRR